MDPIQEAYERAIEAHRALPPLREAYEAASRARSEAFRELRALGESIYGIAKRVGLSQTAVAKIVQDRREGDRRKT